MIDWVVVGFGTLWILGLGLVVAALSFANYLASQQKRRFRQVLEMPACQIMIDLGLMFFCLGWIGSVSGTWERIVWGGLAFMFALGSWQARKIRNI